MLLSLALCVLPLVAALPSVAFSTASQSAASHWAPSIAATSFTHAPIPALPELIPVPEAPAQQTPTKHTLLQKAFYHVYDRVYWNSEFQAARRGAKKGVPEAQLKVGQMYQQGLVRKPDFIKAAKWYGRSSPVQPDSEFLVGRLQQDGSGLLMDKAAGLKAITEAQSRGSKLAQEYLLSKMDNTAAQDYARYKVLAETDPEAADMVGFMTAKGHGTPADPQAAVEWFTKAANAKSHYGQYNLAHCADYGVGMAKNPELALQQYTLSANQGNTFAQLRLGMLKYLTDTPAGHAEALALFTKAADAGLADAQAAAGTIHYLGIGIPEPNYNIAVKYFEKAAAQEHPLATYNLATAYHSGNGVPKNDVRAMDLFKHAAELKSVDAMTFVGYVNLKQGHVDDAIPFLENAAKEQSDTAMYYLGHLYEHNRNQVELARPWYEKAKALGNTEAMRALLRLEALANQ